MVQTVGQHPPLARFHDYLLQVDKEDGLDWYKWMLLYPHYSPVEGRLV